MKRSEVRWSTPKFLLFAFKTYKPYFVAVIFKVVLESVIAVFNSYSLSLILGGLESGKYETALLLALAVVICDVGLSLLYSLAKSIQDWTSVSMRQNINRRIAAKLMSVSYPNLEDPAFLDLKEKVSFVFNNQNTVSRILRSTTGMLGNIVTLASLTSLMFIFDYKLILIVAGGFALNLGLIFLSYRVMRKFMDSIVPVNRRFGYYIDTMMDPAKGKEYRLTGMGDLIAGKFQHFIDIFAVQFRRNFVKNGLISSLMQIVTYVEMGAVYLLIALSALGGRLSVTQFSLYVSTALSFSKTVDAMMNYLFDYLASAQYIVPFLQMMSADNYRLKEGTIILDEPISSIEFDRVSFSYPRTKEPVLTDISFQIDKGQKISIVGLNGSGKTTMVKLLARLYDPDVGRILVNGRDIREYDLDSYRKAISAVYQDYRLFAYSLAENVRAGGTAADDEIMKSLVAVGLGPKVMSLPDGIDTPYGKSLDESGVLLSGGESQKIAIARALVAPASLVILDEPTAALDPLAEAEIYRNFDSLVKERTAIYISHRLSSSVFSDKVLVIEKGRVAAFDTHRNLLKNPDSLYARMFETQARNYRISKTE